MARRKTQGQTTTGYGYTPEEAQTDLERKLVGVDLTRSTPPGMMTLHDAAKELWYPGILHLRDSSRSRYESAYKEHIRGAMGHFLLTEIRPSDIQAFVAALSVKQIKPNGKGRNSRAMEPNGVRYVAGILSQILRAARRDGIIPGNPAEDVRLPRKPAKRERYLTLEDATALVAELAPTPLAAPLFLMVFLGLRRGEVCGLKWDDLDRQTCTLHVQRQRVWSKANVSEGPLKSAQSNRYLKLTPRMIARIDALGDLDSPYICTESGKPWNPNEMTRTWERHYRPDRFEGWTLHDLRHVAAGIIHEITRSPEAVRIILGHASTDMTLGYIADASARTGETLRLLDEAMK